MPLISRFREALVPFSGNGLALVGVIGPSHFAGAGRDALPREPP